MRAGLSFVHLSSRILLHCKSNFRTTIKNSTGRISFVYSYSLDHQLASSINRYVHSSVTRNFKFGKGKEPEAQEEVRITRQGYFQTEDRNKENFIMTVEVFKDKEKLLRGHVEFIYAALKNMEEFGVHRDVEVYKKLMDVFPKVKMVPQNMWQVEFMHFPKQQECAVDVLHQMEYWGVIPDGELQDIIYATFGSHSDPYKKILRMNYWMKKFNNASPWPLPKFVPSDALELAKLAVARMCSVDLTTVITQYDTQRVEAAIDDTWIISGQSPLQQELLQNQPDNEALKVEGPFRIFLREQSINYFVLKADYRPPPEVKEVDRDDISSLFSNPDSEESMFPQSGLVPQRSVHEQEDGTILAICVTGTSSRDSLLSWVRLLSASNPRLGEGLPVVFMQASPSESAELTVAEETSSLINPKTDDSSHKNESADSQAVSDEPKT